MPVRQVIVRAIEMRTVCEARSKTLASGLRARLFTLLHNQYVNDVRRAKRQGTAVEMSAKMADYEPSFSRAAGQEKSVELRDLDRLSPSCRMNSARPSC